MKKALISQPDCSLVRPRSLRTVLSATAMALRLTYASAAAAQSQARTRKRILVGRAFAGAGFDSSMRVPKSGDCFHQPFEQIVHLASSSLIEPEPNRAADNRVLEYPLSHEQMFFHREKRVEARLHGNNRRQWFVN